MHKHLFLQKKEQRYCLLSCEDRYVLVKLKKETEAELLEDIQDEKDIQAKGFSFETILKKDVRSVTVTGGEVGDRVTFVLKKGSRSYALFRKHRVEEIEACFAGVTIKKKRHSHQDFRKNLQSQKGLTVAKRVTYSLDLVAVALAIGIFLSDATDKIWGVGGLTVSLVSLAVYVACPRYFSLFDENSRRKFGYTATAYCLAPAVVGAPCAMFIKVLCVFYVENWWVLILIVLGVTVVATALLFCFVRELRDTGVAWVAVALMVLSCMTGVVGQVNHLLTPCTEETTEQCTVVEMDNGYYPRSSLVCFCTVRPQVGLAKELPVGLVTYFRLDIGDTVTVHQVNGVLGIRYTYLTPTKE